MLRPDAACLRDFSKVRGMNQETPLYRRATRSSLDWAYMLGGVRPQGTTRAGQTVLARLMEI